MLLGTCSSPDHSKNLASVNNDTNGLRIVASAKNVLKGTFSE